MQSGPAAPIAGLPVMSELLKRMADLDEEEAGLLRSMGTAAPQVCIIITGAATRSLGLEGTGHGAVQPHTACCLSD